MKCEDGRKIRVRVSEVHRERYTLQYGNEELYAKLKGTLYKSLENYPVVGDYVIIKYNAYGDSIIEEIEPRTTWFIRPDQSGHAAGYVKTMKEQVLAANYDYAFIVASLNQNYNLNRIMRYISITIQGRGKPVVILTKADLCDNPEEYIREIKNTTKEAEVFVVSSKTGAGLSQITPYLEKDRTIILLGSSGVGKSSLVNKLAGREIMYVSDIREKDAKGRHTTTHRQLIQMPSGAIVIDTPGMREIGVIDVEEGVNDTFSDIVELIYSCRFSNCKHNGEPGCGVQRAIEEGILSRERFELYRGLQRENRWATQKARKNSRKQ